MIRTWHIPLIALLATASVGVAQPAIPKDRIPADAPAEVRREIETLYSSNADERGQACVRLGDMGAKAAPAAPFLAGLLGDDSEFICRRIVMGHMERGPSRVRAEAIAALWRIRDPAAPAVLAALRSENRLVRLGAAEALSSIGGEGVVPALLASLKDSDAAVRAAAAKSLSGRNDAAAAVEPLIGALKDASPEVRKSAATTLGHLKDGRAVEPLLAVVKDPDAGVRAEALAALGWLKAPRALEPLLAGLADPDPRARYWAACMVGQFKDERVAPALAALLRDDDHLVRMAAAGALGNLKDARSVEPLIAVLQDPKAADRWAAAGALGKLKDRRAVGPLIAALEGNDENVARYAAEALGEIGDRAAVEPLVAALKARGALARGWVARALGNLADERAAGPLVAALKDTDDSTRFYAAWGLGRIRSRAAVEPLIDLLEREPKEGREDRFEGASGPGVRDRAAEALKEITGQDFGDDAAKWRAWLKENPLGRLSPMLQVCYAQGRLNVNLAGPSEGLAVSWLLPKEIRGPLRESIDPNKRFPEVFLYRGNDMEKYLAPSGAARFPRPHETAVAGTLECEPGTKDKMVKITLRDLQFQTVTIPQIGPFDVGLDNPPAP